MGFRICYIASRLAPSELAQSLGLEISDAEAELPDGNWWVAHIKKSGWSILWSEDEEFGARSQNLIAQSSQKADLIHCHVNETCMWSSSVYWSEGHTLWKVTHAGDGDNIFDLMTEGKLPKQFEDIKNKHFLAQKQDNDCDHIFEIPLELAKSFMGFRHEDCLEEDEVDAFHIISEPRKRNFLTRILGR